METCPEALEGGVGVRSSAAYDPSVHLHSKKGTFMPGGTFVYVSNADTKDIRVLTLDSANGDLAEVQRVQLSANGPLGPLAVSPNRRFLYAAQRAEPWTVSA